MTSSKLRLAVFGHDVHVFWPGYRSERVYNWHADDEYFGHAFFHPITYIFLFVAGILNKINKRCVYLLWAVPFVVWKVSWCSCSLHGCFTSLFADQKCFHTESVVFIGGAGNYRHGEVANCRHLIYVNLDIKLRCRLCLGERWQLKVISWSLTSSRCQPSNFVIWNRTSRTRIDTAMPI